MAAIEVNGESLQKCEWCGKSSIDSTWSSKKRLYCSFRCNAAGSYRMYASISIIFWVIIAIVAMLTVMMQIGSSTSQPIDLFSIFSMIGLIGLIIWFSYAANVGRSMRKERNINL